MNVSRPIQCTLALTFALLANASFASAGDGVVSGRVSALDAPLPASQVYAYQLGELTLRKVTTDEDGSFAFRDLPTGLYKIIAFKPGFLPGIALLTRASLEARQFLDVELQSQDSAATDSAADIWSVRQQIPTDILHDIDMASMSPSQETSTVAGGIPVRARMQALTGVDSMATTQTASLSGGQVDVASEIDQLNVDVRGRYVELASRPGDLDAPEANGHTQMLSVNVTGVGTNRINVTSLDNSLDTAETGQDRMGLQSHRLSWSRGVGARGHSQVAAHYIEENNFYSRGVSGSMAMPSGSREWNLEGSYASSVGQRSSVEAGFNYRERQFELAGSGDPLFDGILPGERVDVFGRAGTSVTPSVLVEYGVYSTMRDGSLSFAPQGGVVLQLGDDWRAATAASLRVHEDPVEARRFNDFRTGHYSDYSSCEGSSSECYQVSVAKMDGDQERMSFGAIHRTFDETLRLQFDDNFFNYRENLQLVRGDTVPELQFALTQRLSPNILARVESSLGIGGGGRLALDENEHFENEVSYLVTSVDTRFEQTATGVLVAFHQLRQNFNSMTSQTPEEQLALERIQVALTQDLAVLGSMAADWALQLNMELSRGALPSDDSLDDDIRERITGGLAVKF